MAFNGNEGELITLTTASSWTENYRNGMGSGDPKAHFFGIHNIQDLLDQTGCKGIRIYHGINDDDEKVLILVAADEDEDDMTDAILEKGVLCPPRCGRSNDLNS